MVTAAFSFCVAGTPVPKQRAIPVTIAGKRRMVTARNTRRYKRLVRTVCRLHVPPDWPLTGRFGVHLLICVPDRRKRDLDNIEKAAWDAMKGIAYADDHQVDDSSKRRVLDKARPRLEVRVERLT